MEHRHQDGGAQDRLIRRPLLFDLADDRQPFLDLRKGARIGGAAAARRWAGLGRNGVGHFLSFECGDQELPALSQTKLTNPCAAGKFPFVKVNGSPRTPQPHVERTLSAMAEVSGVEADDVAAEFRQREPHRHLPP